MNTGKTSLHPSDLLKLKTLKLPTNRTKSKTPKTHTVMASTSRVFTGCRALYAAARASAAKSTQAPAAPAATAKPKKAPKTTVAAAAAAKASRSNSGILKLVPVSPALSNFVGAPEINRNIAVKKIWEYIKTNNLQSPENKKIIQCDEKLKTIFDGKDEVGFLEIAGLLSRHFVKTTK